MNSSREPSAEMSVILVVPETYAGIRSTMRALSKQTFRDRLEVVLVASDQDTARGFEADQAAFHSVRVVELGEILTMSTSRAAGIRAASAPLIALGEDHAFPDPKWAEVLITTHRENWAGVGPAFLNGNPGLLSWLGLIMDYGRWIEPVVGGVMDDIPGHGTAWKRTLLLEYGSQLEYMMQAPILMHWDMQARGHKLYLEPSAKVRHVNIPLFFSFLIDHFLGARIFAAVRAREWSWIRRLIYVAANPFFMVRRLRGWLRNMRRAGLETELLPRAWPMLFLSAACSSLGELTGLCLGDGRAERTILKYDGARAPFVTPHERHQLFGDGSAGDNNAVGAGK